MQSPRLDFRPLSPQAILALVDGYDQFANAFHVPAADGLRDFFVSGDLSPDYLAQLAAATEPDPWIFGFAVVHRADRVVIGAGGFKGLPAPEINAQSAAHRSVVEIAYGIVPTYQCQGFATETAQALVDFAIADGRANTIRAHTLPEPNASTRVLTKCGFNKVGEVVDPEDGLVWRWERLVSLYDV
jgi:[ribosomal protein S5]-alanine N-acetyltransferase